MSDLIAWVSLVIAFTALIRARKADKQSSKNHAEQEIRKHLEAQRSLPAHATYLLGLVAELPEHLNDAVRHVAMWTDGDLDDLMHLACGAQ